MSSSKHLAFIQGFAGRGREAGRMTVTAGDTCSSAPQPGTQEPLPDLQNGGPGWRFHFAIYPSHRWVFQSESLVLFGLRSKTSRLFKTESPSPTPSAPGQRTLERLPGGKKSATRAGRRELWGSLQPYLLHRRAHNPLLKFPLHTDPHLQMFTKLKIIDFYHSGLTASGIT